MLTIGRKTPERIDIIELRLYVSEIYDGIHVMTPSLKAPCKIIASITTIKSGKKNKIDELFSDLAAFLTFAESFLTGTSIQNFSQTNIIIVPNIAEKRNTERHPKRAINGGDTRYIRIVPNELPQHTITEEVSYSSGLNISDISLTIGGHINACAIPLIVHITVI